MATTTPNFGWSVPESTDLVKDGATAIELLGDSIDTSFVDLLGGTTGQILSKASGTDLDFTWSAASTNSLTLLSTTSLSGATTTISSISGAYKNLVILIKDFYSSSNSEALMGINGDNTAANYQNLVNRGAGGTTGLFADNSVAGAYVSGYQMINTQQDSFAAITIPDYANTTTKKVISIFCASTSTSGTQGSTNTNCVYKGTITAISEINIKTSAGTWSAGTVEIYGQN
jgi:hypothetical protein